MIKISQFYWFTDFMCSLTFSTLLKNEFLHSCTYSRIGKVIGLLVSWCCLTFYFTFKIRICRCPCSFKPYLIYHRNGRKMGWLLLCFVLFVSNKSLLCSAYFLRYFRVGTCLQWMTVLHASKVTMNKCPWDDSTYVTSCMSVIGNSLLYSENIPYRSEF